MREIKITYCLLIFLLITFTDNFASAGRLCCHNHGGVKKCYGTAKHLCDDGAYGNCPKHNH